MERPPAGSKSVLLILSHSDSRESLAEILRAGGFQPREVERSTEAFATLAVQQFDAALVDLDLPDADPLALVRGLRQRARRTPILVLASPSRLDVAREALRHGAEDFLFLPPDPAEIGLRLRRILERRDLDSRIALLQGEISKSLSVRQLVSRSPSMQAVMDRIRRIAPLRSTALIQGESGVGKELVARAIHFSSPRRDGPFIALNCAAMPQSLIESELFGHEKGAFTGAHALARGKFEIAHGGTIFLDEIGEMDPSTQATLLRVLEEREFMRVGGDRSIRVDVRVIAATNANLEELVERGLFRRDLYYRLKVVSIHVPPLRERRLDLPVLIETFLDELARANALRPKVLTPEVGAALEAYSWPGNVRELKNVLESILVSSPGTEIRLEDLPPAIRRQRASPEVPLPAPGTTVAEMERELVRRTLEHTGGNRTHSASLLGIGVRTLQRKIRIYRLEIPSTKRRPRRRAGTVSSR